VDSGLTNISAMIKNILIGFLGGAICFIVALIVGLIIQSLFPTDGPAYVGIGLDGRNLPGTILGILAWIGFVMLMSRRSTSKR
jgi:hypothetical protein